MLYYLEVFPTISCQFDAILHFGELVANLYEFVQICTISFTFLYNLFKK